MKRIGPVLTLSAVLGAGIWVSAQAGTAVRQGAALAADRVARIDRVLQEYVDQNRVAGVVALVLRDGQPAYEKGGRVER